MGYSNFRNEETHKDSDTSNSSRYNVSSEDLLKKKESYWFIALVVTLILIGTVVFYCAHTGGQVIYF